MACLGITLGIIGSAVIDAQRTAMEHAKQVSKHRVLSLFHSDANANKLVAMANIDSETDELIGSSEQQEALQNSELAVADEGLTLQHIGLEFLVLIVVLFLFAFFFSSDIGIQSVGWNNIGDLIYFGIVTATTIGYGDFTPQSQHGRLYAVVGIPIVVGMMGHWLAIVAGYIIDRKQSRFRHEMANKELTLEDLAIMDEDGDGEVTQVEFLEFMLVAMNKVDVETLQYLHMHFQRLDRDGSGVLSKNDLLESARQKLQQTRHKLDLSNYKQSLLKIGSSR